MSVFPSLAHALTIPSTPLPPQLILPTSKPVFSEPLSPNLASFSIEMDRWPQWAGEAVGSPNAYTMQLLANLAVGTGATPSFRVGADSEDRGYIDPGVAILNATFPPVSADVPIPEATSDGIGRDFYALSANFPTGTKFTWGLNLKYLNKSETVLQAKLLANTFQGTRRRQLSKVQLELVEIGNEPDFYAFGPTWSPANYTQTWKTFATAVADVVRFKASGTTLQTGAFAGDNPFIWYPGAVLNAGLLDSKVAPVTSTFSEHMYYGAFGYGPPAVTGDLMNKVNVRNNLTTYSPHIAQAHAAGLKFVLGETNSYANHGEPGVSNSAEAAIWGVDHLLFSASIGVERLHFHHGVGYKYNLFQPVANASDGLNISRPHILPSYHSFLITNEAIGTSGNSYVAELTTSNNSVAAYGIWEGTKLARVVLINSLVYVPDSGARDSITFPIINLPSGAKVTAKRLAIPFTTSTTGLTWGGVSYEGASGVPNGTFVPEVVSGGNITIAASEVVLLTLA